MQSPISNRQRAVIQITMARNEAPPKQASVTNCASILDPLLLGQRAVETHLVTNSLQSTGTDQAPESPIWRRRCNGISYPEVGTSETKTVYAVAIFG